MRKHLQLSLLSWNSHVLKATPDRRMLLILSALQFTFMNVSRDKQSFSEAQCLLFEYTVHSLSDGAVPYFNSYGFYPKTPAIGYSVVSSIAEKEAKDRPGHQV